MLYKKNGSPRLSDELFANPTSEYRGAPFWAWNCALSKDEMSRQIDVMREMGFGGYHMHVRTGLDTPYLTDEFMDYIEHCVNYGEENKMLSWLYDEDRWPSGAAGGLVTKEERFRARYLLFTPESYEEHGESTEKRLDASAKAQRAQNGTLIGCYDVVLNDDGSLKSYRKMDRSEQAEGTRWYAYLEIATPSGWYNNQTYVNTLDKKAIDRFIEITYESYNRRIGDRMGESVPAIFTDEPQFTHKVPLRYAKQAEDVIMPWTDDLPDTFAQAYGEDLMAHLPELFWDLPQGEASVIRYHYHDHVCERFTQAFADNCGAWCREHNLKLTGHMMEEPTLRSQTAALGEAMRSYRGFDLPGIDMLCAYLEYTTAKQTQSAVHQFGYEGMMSELYGVTNWDFDFRGHKLHGDWQAALGVTVRVPHLTWMSMKGEAKRDYPASINYQSPWWREYSAVEDHFARLNTALTRGKPSVRVGMIHPIESFWLHWGPQDVSGEAKERLETLFQNMTQWLLFGMVDFDFISESLLPQLCEKGGAPLQVGKMAYDAIIVPGCETLRSTTLDRLEAFQKAGGKLIFVGDAPKLCDAKLSDRAAKLYENSLHAEASRASVLRQLEDVREIDVRDESGSRTDYLLHQMRDDNGCKWLFLCHGKEPYNPDICRSHEVRLTIRGRYAAELYDTQTGAHYPISAHISGDHTELAARMYDYDSILVRLTPAESGAENLQVEKPYCHAEAKLEIPAMVPVTLDEPNALLLDRAEFALDDEPYAPAMELLRADNVCRAKLGWPSREGHFPQPWVIPAEKIEHSVRLRFTIHSEIAVFGAKLALEDADLAEISFNGEKLAAKPDGWYVDRAIGAVALPEIPQGVSTIEVRLPFGQRTNVEWCYVIGDFGVRVNGLRATIIEPVRELGFGDFCTQGLPFYGGNVTYHVPFASAGNPVEIQIPHYRGAMCKVQVDSGDSARVIYPPYVAKFEGLSKGEHTAHITLFGHRRNSFGPVHLSDLKEKWIGPNSWRSEGDRWSDSYQICREGILSEPRFSE